MKARPYQIECVNAVHAAYREHSSVLVEAATGLGKTVIFAFLAKDWPGRVLVIAHREELVQQAADKIYAITGEMPGIEMAENRVIEDGILNPQRIVVGSVQTLCRGRCTKFSPDQFSLVIIDEAHHAVGASYRTVLEWFYKNPDCKVLGVTATPKRADDLALGQVFNHVAYRYGIEPAVDDGWLVPVAQHCVQVEGLDFSKVKSLAGDFNEAELEKILTEEKMLHAVAAPTIEVAGDRPTLVFCCTVRHAEMMAAILNRYKPHCAAWLSGKTPTEERQNTVERFKKGGLQILCNCSLFLEGFDSPNTAVVVMARPTKSIVLYTQVIGRATRPLPGVVDNEDLETPEARKAAIAASDKPGMMVLDFVGNAGRHKIVTALDVLGGKYGMPVREFARQAVSEEQRPVPVEEALEGASLVLALLNEEEERRKRIVAQAQYKLRTISPFDRSQAASRVGTTTPGRPVDPPSQKQINFLVYLGVSRATAESYSKRQASAVIDSLVAKKEKAATSR